MTYEYDAVGNRIHANANYQMVGSDVDLANPTWDKQDHWYSYDSMNRFIISQGSLVAGSVVQGTGTHIGYDMAGRRQTAIYGSQETTEVYAYDVNGFLQTITVDGIQRAENINAANGQRLQQKEWHTAGELALSDAARNSLSNPNALQLSKNILYQYNADGVTANETFAHRTGGTFGVDYTYDRAGNLTSTGTFGETNNTTTTYTYEYWDDYKRSTINIDSEDTSPGYTNFKYDVNGHISEALDAFDSRRLVYATNAKGQILKRTESGVVENKDYKRIHQYYYANGIGIGAIELIENGRPAFRTIYVAKFKNAVYVLHSFTKTTNGVDRQAMATAKRRYKVMKAELKK